mgnify:CR=1 FL=1
MTDPAQSTRRRTVRYIAIFLVTAGISTALDLVSKWWVFQEMGAKVVDGQAVHEDGSLPGDEIHTDISKTFFQIRLRVNRGAVWGILRNKPELLLALSIFAIGFIVYMLIRSKERDAPLPVSLGLICGGALGNLWDRQFHDGVRDFLHVFWKDPIAMAWPTFNLADVFICIGVGLYLFLEIFSGKEEDEKAKKEPAKA